MSELKKGVGYTGVKWWVDKKAEDILVKWIKRKWGEQGYKFSDYILEKFANWVQLTLNDGNCHFQRAYLEAHENGFVALPVWLFDAMLVSCVYWGYNEANNDLKNCLNEKLWITKPDNKEE